MLKISGDGGERMQCAGGFKRGTKRRSEDNNPDGNPAAAPLPQQVGGFNPDDYFRVQAVNERNSLRLLTSSGRSWRELYMKSSVVLQHMIW